MHLLIQQEISLPDYIDTAGNIITRYYKLNNHFYYNLVWGVQYVIIAYFYYHTLQSRVIKKIILGFFAFFPIFFIVNACCIQGFYTLQTFSIISGASFMLLFAVSYIWQVYTSTETQSIFRDPVFWFSLAWLFYYGLTAPYFGMLNYLLNNDPDFASRILYLGYRFFRLPEKFITYYRIFMQETATK
jgi:hypothetical protein